MLHGHTTHKTQSPTYTTYQNMIRRCHYPGHAKFHAYGGKGIQVCDRWRESFVNFLADMGERPNGMTIDRRDGLQGYFPDNCRWATPKEQQSNIKTNVRLTFDGRTQCLASWANEVGLTPTLLAWRVRHGWGLAEALNTPAKLGNRTRTTGQVLLTYQGKTQCNSQWARDYGLSNSLLRLRLSKGWALEAALLTPKGVWVTKDAHTGKS